MCILQVTSKTSSPPFELFAHDADILLVGAVGSAGDYVVSSTDIDWSQLNCSTHTHTLELRDLL